MKGSEAWLNDLRILLLGVYFESCKQWIMDSRCIYLMLLYLRQLPRVFLQRVLYHLDYKEQVYGEVFVLNKS